MTQQRIMRTDVNTLQEDKAMMKRLMALSLALLMLLTATAYATEWEEDLGPQKPNEQLREIDLNDKLGYMLCYPNEKIGPIAGVKTLFIYLPREDVELNSNGGNFILRSDDKGEEYRLAANDSNSVILRPMLDSEKSSLGVGSGVWIEINLPVSLRLGRSYSLDIDAGCIVVPGLERTHEKITNATRFVTNADYGVSELSYIRTKDNGNEETVVGKITAGDTARFDIVIGGDAKAATIIPGEGISFSAETVTESCEVTATITGDNPTWQVVFWDVEIAPTDFDEVAQHLIDRLDF